MQIKKISSGIDKSLLLKQRQLSKIPRQAYKYFKEKTPVKTGNAKRNTDFIGNNTIFADYKYATLLNQGKSKQARQGMTKPTLDYVRQLIRKIF